MSARVSERLTALGPYFAAASHDPDSEPHPPWRVMSELLDNPDVMAARVAAVRTYLATAGGLTPDSVEVRVAASVAHLGLAARLLSPLFALAADVERGDASAVSLRTLRWQPAVGSTFALSIPGLEQAEAEHAPATPQARGVSDAWTDFEPLAVELCELVRPLGVSPRVVWGNIASAVNGARIALSSAAPESAARALVVRDRLLAHPRLAGTFRASPGGAFQRRSCCLIYRAAPDRRGPLCGDCVLRRS
jgi:hypothetical protein